MTIEDDLLDALDAYGPERTRTLALISIAGSLATPRHRESMTDARTQVADIVANAQRLGSDPNITSARIFRALENLGLLT